MNYWSLKQSTEKSHKTLFKFIKKFKTYLNECVMRFIKADKIDLSSMSITKLNYKEFICNIEALSDPQHNLRIYLTKTNKFCLKILKKKTGQV